MGFYLYQLAVIMHYYAFLNQADPETLIYLECSSLGYFKVCYFDSTIDKQMNKII